MLTEQSSTKSIPSQDISARKIEKNFRQNFEKVPKAILVCAKSMQIDALLDHFTLVGSTKDKNLLISHLMKLSSIPMTSDRVQPKHIAV